MKQICFVLFAFFPVWKRRAITNCKCQTTLKLQTSMCGGSYKLQCAVEVTNFNVRVKRESTSQFVTVMFSDTNSFQLRTANMRKHLVNENWTTLNFKKIIMKNIYLLLTALVITSKIFTQEVSFTNPGVLHP